MLTSKGCGGPGVAPGATEDASPLEALDRSISDYERWFEVLSE